LWVKWALDGVVARTGGRAEDSSRTSGRAKGKRMEHARLRGKRGRNSCTGNQASLERVVRNPDKSWRGSGKTRREGAARREKVSGIAERERIGWVSFPKQLFAPATEMARSCCSRKSFVRTSGSPKTVRSKLPALHRIEKRQPPLVGAQGSALKGQVPILGELAPHPSEKQTPPIFRRLSVRPTPLMAPIINS